MKRTLVIICTLLASAGCQRSDRPEQETSPSLLPPPTVDDPGATRTAPPQLDPSMNVDPGMNPPVTAAERQNMSGTDDPAAGTAPGDQTQNPSDRALTQRIREALGADDTLSASARNANIRASNGVVTLSGPAQSSQEKTRITTLVSRIEGVKRLENQLRVSGD